MGRSFFIEIFPEKKNTWSFVFVAHRLFAATMKTSPGITGRTRVYNFIVEFRSTVVPWPFAGNKKAKVPIASFRFSVGASQEQLGKISKLRPTSLGKLNKAL